MVLAGCALVVMGCGRPDGESAWSGDRDPESASLRSDLATMVRHNRLLELELRLAEEDTFYAVVDLGKRKLGLRMKGVSLREWEILGMAVHPSAGMDGWVGSPLGIAEKEVVADRRSGSQEQHWQEVTTSELSGRNGNGGQDSVGRSASPAQADSAAGGYDSNRGLPTSYDLLTDKDLVISIRTQADLGRTRARFDEWRSLINQAIGEAISSLTGGSGHGRIQIILDGEDCQSIFRSVQVGMRVILLP